MICVMRYVGRIGAQEENCPLLLRAHMGCAVRWRICEGRCRAWIYGGPTVIRGFRGVVWGV